MIRDVQIRDASGICDIYNYYVDNSTITFDTEPMSAEQMIYKIEVTQEKKHPFIVWISEDDKILGYAYCGGFRARSAYAKTVEISVYVDHNARRKGIGRALLKDLLDRARDGGYHTAVSVISLPNDASEALHESVGFELKGTIRDAGYKYERYVDIAFWQRML